MKLKTLTTLAAVSLALAGPLAARADDSREADAAVRSPVNKGVIATKQDYTADAQARQKAADKAVKGQLSEQDTLLIFKLWTPAF